jgi:putative hydrolase of the HAD superfamily
MTMVQAVLFDLGDTLIHGNFTTGETEIVWAEVYQTIINPANDPLIPDLTTIRKAIADNVGKAMAYTWKHKVEEEMEIIPLFAKAFAVAGLTNCNDNDFIHKVVSAEQGMLYKRIVEVGSTVFSTLETLRERGYKLGLVSNFCNIPSVVKDNLNELGLLSYFDQVVISCELGWRKPSPKVYEAISKQIGIAPAECLFVGDRLIEDVLGPQKAGMKAVLTHEFRQEDLDPNIKPDALIKRLDEVLEILTKL